MSLPSLQLDAFLSVVKTGGFSKAARALGVTQSALSQRVKNLEDELRTTLLLRGSGGVTATPAGHRLVAYCRTRHALEEELVTELKGGATAVLAGAVRIAGYSSVLRSVVLPALSPLLRAHPGILAELSSREMGHLPGILQRGKADFVVADFRIERTGVEALHVGQEEYVVIESTRHPKRPDVYIDHDPEDTATHLFFRAQKGKPPDYRRMYLDDVYGVLDGVRHGIGRAVMSRHLIRGEKGVRVLKDYAPRKVDVWLHYHAQPYYTRLHAAVVNACRSLL